MFHLRKHSAESHLFEILEQGEVIEEIAIAFVIKKIPSFFESLESLKQWLSLLEAKLARQSAYRFMVARNHSSQGLLRKLEAKGFSSSLCHQIICDLQRLEIIKDDAFIAALIERELRRGYGPRYIEAKLRSQGLPIDQVRKIVTAEKQREQIARLAPKLSGRLEAALQRRGFDFDCIREPLA
jgi:SOS response regulatory protein OraA/RecX